MTFKTAMMPVAGAAAGYALSLVSQASGGG